MATQLSARGSAGRPTCRTWATSHQGNQLRVASPINAPDGTEVAVPGDGYATRHDPFMYFHSIIDNTTYCDAHVVALGDPSSQMPPSPFPMRLGSPTDLHSVATAADFSFITPNLCKDGHDFPCINQPSGQSTLRGLRQLSRDLGSEDYRVAGFQTQRNAHRHV